MPCDYSKYPPNWKTEIVPAVLEREHNCCKFCAARNGAIIYRPRPGLPDWRLAPEGHLADSDLYDGVKFIKVVLTVAHLDHDEQNHQVKLERLAALCQRCHLRYDVNEKRARKIKKQNGGNTLF
jgi:hypothetical protein